MQSVGIMPSLLLTMRFGLVLSVPPLKLLHSTADFEVTKGLGMPLMICPYDKPVVLPQLHQCSSHPYILAILQYHMWMGVLGYNNPIRPLIDEARQIWGDRKIGCIVGIGTGVPKFKAVGRKIPPLIESLKAMATD